MKRSILPITFCIAFIAICMGISNHTAFATSPLSTFTGIVAGPDTAVGAASIDPLRYCDCSQDLYNCSDFQSQDDAQACYWNCGAQNRGDIHKLDMDVNRVACDGQAVQYPAPLPPPSSNLRNCDCSRDYYDCSDFQSQDDAQACYWNCGAQNRGDVHKLDLDVNMVACDIVDFPVQIAPTPLPAAPVEIEPTSAPPTSVPPTAVPVMPTATPAPASMSQSVTLRGEVWVDNWFSFYLGEQFIMEDSVSITTERSFNSETFTFEATYPLSLNFIMKDFKENDTGLEYIGTSRQQMGDGGLIAQFTDVNTGQVVAVTNSSWSCLVIHDAPVDKSCESETNPTVGQGVCDFVSSPEPTGWKSIGFDDSNWPNATVHSSAAVSPKIGYDDISWNSSAQFIWGPDLETNNTILCRLTVQAP